MTYHYVIGMDVGKHFHHACVLDEHGTPILSKQANQHETSLRDLFASFIGKLDQSHDVLVVVDQPNNIGRLTVAIARSMGTTVRYLPGLAMRQLSRIHVGNAKTDVREAYVIAMPSIGPKSAAQILMTVGDMSDFPSAAHVASYAGLSPRTNQSGTSIMSNSLNRAGNKKLKNALWQSSFASIRFHERSPQFYKRKRKEGKRHNAAVVALSRRRLNVLFAMMRNGELYREIVPEVIAAA